MQFLTRLLLFTLILCGSLVLAEDVLPDAESDGVPEITNAGSQLDLKTEKVMVIKDNYGLFYKTGEATTNENGQVYTSQIPEQILLGTLWTHSKRGKLQQVTFKWHEHEKKSIYPVTASSVLEILLANQNQYGQLHLKDGSRYRGLFLKVLLNEGNALVNDRYANETMRFPQETFTAADPNQPLKPNATGTHFILRTLENDILLPIEAVHSIKINDMKTRIMREVTQQEREKRVDFQFANANRLIDIEMAYFRTGISWIPTYQLNLKPKHVTLTLQASVVNNAEDLINVPLELVTGVPQFQFREQFSPMLFTAPDMSVEQTLHRAYDIEIDTTAETVDTEQALSDMQAEQANDIFVYRIPARTLLNGEKAVFPLMQVRAPFKHVYTWNIHIKHPKAADLKADKRGTLPLRTTQNDIWHKLELTNETKQPWVTGSVLIESNGQRFSQMVLSHTAPGGSVLLPLHKATDIHKQISQREIQRQVKDYKVGDNQYTRIDRQLRLSVTNHKDTDALIEVNLMLGGIVDRVPAGAEKIEKSFNPNDWTEYEGDPSANKHTLIRWRTSIKAKQSFNRSISYFLRVLD